MNDRETIDFLAGYVDTLIRDRDALTARVNALEVVVRSLIAERAPTPAQVAPYAVPVRLAPQSVRLVRGIREARLAERQATKR